MLSVNVKNQIIELKDITRENLTLVYKWYNQTEYFWQATGVENEQPYSKVILHFNKVISSSLDFYISVNLNHCKKMIGMIFGNINEKNKILWIKAIIIDPKHQRNGYGEISIQLLLYYFIKNFSLKSVMISVEGKNTDGIRFWEKLGFVKIKTLNNHHTNKNGLITDIIIMQKVI